MQYDYLVGEWRFVEEVIKVLGRVDGFLLCIYRCLCSAEQERMGGFIGGVGVES